LSWTLACFEAVEWEDLAAVDLVDQAAVLVDRAAVLVAVAADEVAEAVRVVADSVHQQTTQSKLPV
jgi:hypothetical protein